MKKKRIFICEVLTCNRRKLDAFKIRKYFSLNKYQVIQNPKDSDIILLVTCAYSNNHARTSLDTVKKFLDYDAELIVIGCLPEIEKEELAKIFSGKTISTKELDRIDELFSENEIKFDEIDDANFPLENSNEYILISDLKKVFGKSQVPKKIIGSFLELLLKNMVKCESANCHRNIINYSYFKYFKERMQPSLTYHQNSYFIRPSWGCLGSCSYCVIKKAIGPLKSKPLDTIINEFNKGLRFGYNNFIFDADDLGAYGMDNDTNFAEMLDRVTDIPGDYSVHLRYIHPTWLVKYGESFEKALKKGKIKSLGSAIQSGNPRILKHMNRFYDVGKVKNTFSRIKESYPNIMIATECINGFPTETKEEFEDTLNFIKEIGFNWGFIFPFSSRPGSGAWDLEPKVPKKEILNRMKYAKRHLKTVGYKSSFFKNHNILVFSAISSNVKFDEGTKSFCFSTVE